MEKLKPSQPLSRRLIIHFPNQNHPIIKLNNIKSVDMSHANKAQPTKMNLWLCVAFIKASNEIYG